MTSRSKRPTVSQILFTATRDASHATSVAVCKRCKQERPFWMLLAPDPQQRAQESVDQRATLWLHTHPCAGADGGIPTKLTPLGLLSTMNRQHGGEAA